MNKKISPFLWTFQEDVPKTNNTTNAEEELTASVGEETNLATIETIYEKIV